MGEDQDISPTKRRKTVTFPRSCHDSNFFHLPDTFGLSLNSLLFVQALHGRITVVYCLARSGYWTNKKLWSQTVNLLMTIVCNKFSIQYSFDLLFFAASLVCRRLIFILLITIEVRWKATKKDAWKKIVNWWLIYANYTLHSRVLSFFLYSYYFFILIQWNAQPLPQQMNLVAANIYLNSSAVRFHSMC